jgi:hypothetical protein
MPFERKDYNETPVSFIDEINKEVTLSGISIPEYPDDFYLPFLKQLDEKFRRWDKITFNFKFKYYNTGTTRHITYIILKLYALDKIKQVVVNWYYPKNDTDMEESGLDYKDMYEFREFNLIET